LASTESSSRSRSEGERPAIIRPEDPRRLSAAEEGLCRDAFSRGGLIAFPTDTVYGVGADAGNPEAIGHLFEAKQRPPGKPLPVLIDGPHRLLQCCPKVPDAAWALAREFWPGPLTIVVPRSHLICPEAVGGRDTVGLRMPDLPLARHVLSAVWGPMAVTSANLSGEESTVSSAEVLRTLGPWLDLLIDAEVPSTGLPSTVIDLSTSPPRVLRQGGVTIEQLRTVVDAVL
jgi:L-threonylcarbamoyladenylate synthase